MAKVNRDENQMEKKIGLIYYSYLQNKQSK